MKEKSNIEDILKTNNDKASVDNNDTNAAIKEEIKTDDSRIISVKDLVDALSILLVSSKEVIIPNVKELIDVMDMQIETPLNLSEMPVELDFDFDERGEWCVCLARQRLVKELWRGR